jgi:hypothetical protein
MSEATQTKIFGMRLGIDPKILVGALIALAALLFWFNSGGGQGSNTGTASHATPSSATPVTAAKARTPLNRRRNVRDNRGTLRIATVDATRGDIDPVLRLDFLERLSKIEAPTSIRNLFERGPATSMAATNLPTRIVPVKAKLPPAPPPAPPPVIAPPTANIPYKYYGFAKPTNVADGNRGFFMEGDNILVAVEGQLLQQRYLVVQLTPTTARVEDIQVKLGRNLALEPEAVIQAGGAVMGGGRPASQGMMNPAMNPAMNPQPNEGADDNQ